MRLIRKKAAVDSIIAYDDMAKKLADQLVYYERYQNESVNSSFELLNFKYYQSGLNGKNASTGLYFGCFAEPLTKPNWWSLATGYQYIKAWWLFIFQD